MTILTLRRSRQTVKILPSKLSNNFFKHQGRDMMTLIHLSDLAIGLRVAYYELE